MCQLRSCRNRRTRRFVRCCALLFVTLVIARHLTGRNTFSSSDDDINNTGAAEQRTHDAGPSRKDAFARHFQETFHFHSQDSETGNGTESLITARVLSQPDDWPQFFVPRPQPQFSLAYPYRYRAERTCTPPVEVLVLVLSLPQNRVQRQAIRATWGSVVMTGVWPGGSPPDLHTRLSRHVGVVFLLAEERRSPGAVSEDVKMESEEYGDVVQWVGLQDTYFNLTMKVLLGLQWATEHCPKASHVIKTDDDTFVHVPRLLHRLLTSSTENATNTIWGPFFHTSPCERVGKYEVSRDAYPFELYPPHVKGNLYVLSADLVPRIFMLAPYLPYNNMEDVHVTGTLARVLGARHQSFSWREFSVIPKVPDPCLFQENRKSLGAQMVSPELAVWFWKTMSGTAPCREM